MFEGHLDPAGGVILYGTLLLFFGIIGRYIAKLFNQSGVLGELLMGVFLGNICYFGGMQLMVILRDSPAVFAIVQNILEGMPRADAVNAVINNQYYANQVYAALSGPNGNDWIKISYVVDMLSRYGVIFLLFMVGLESSVTELRKTGKEAFYVAVIGILMPIIFGILSVYLLMHDIKFTTALFIGATLSATSVGITASVLKDMKKINTMESKTILGAAMIDDVLGLIILAVVSGMVISNSIDVYDITKIIVLSLLFTLIGIQVRIETFLDWQVIETASILIIVAIIGKLLSGFGANKRDDRLLIGIGMMPRGEVGLIFASVGKTLGVINDSLFSSIIIMVVTTTILTPILMKARYNKHDKKLAK